MVFTESNRFFCCLLRRARPLLALPLIFALGIQASGQSEPNFGPHVSEGPWTFHAEHGWQLWGIQPPGNGLFFDMEFGWGWTRPDLYPWIHWYGSGLGWSLFQVDSTISGERRFLEPATAQWRPLHEFGYPVPAPAALPPRPLVRTVPSYPPAMRNAGVQGDVVIEFVVRMDGTSDAIEFREYPHPDFKEPVVDAVERWKFIPGFRDGGKVDTRVRQRIPFRLRSAPPHPLE